MGEYKLKKYRLLHNWDKYWLFLYFVEYIALYIYRTSQRNCSLEVHGVQVNIEI